MVPRESIPVSIQESPCDCVGGCNRGAIDRVGVVQDVVRQDLAQERVIHRDGCRDIGESLVIRSEDRLVTHREFCEK